MINNNFKIIIINLFKILYLFLLYCFNITLTYLKLTTTKKNQNNLKATVDKSQIETFGKMTLKVMIINRVRKVWKK